MGFSDMLFIFFLALIIFGPKKLPEMARQAGKLMAEFKRHSNEFKSQLENEIQIMDRQERLKKFEAEHPKILPPEASIPKTAATTYRQPSFASVVEGKAPEAKESKETAPAEAAESKPAEARPVESAASTPISEQPATPTVAESPATAPNTHV